MIWFYDIYRQAVSLFDDPDITEAYDTNKIRFAKLMHPYLETAIPFFTNPSIIGRLLSEFESPKGVTEVIVSDGNNTTYPLSFIPENPDDSLFEFIADGRIVNGEYDKESNSVTFSILIPEGKEYSFESYYGGKFTSEFDITSNRALNAQIDVQVSGILARLLVKAWGENTRNYFLDIQNILTDNDFKLHPNGPVLKAKVEWLNKIDEETNQMQNKLAHMIRFGKTSSNWGRRYN